MGPPQCTLLSDIAHGALLVLLFYSIVHPAGCRSVSPGRGRCDRAQGQLAALVNQVR
jgi:hypothetical protein